MPGTPTSVTSWTARLAASASQRVAEGVELVCAADERRCRCWRDVDCRDAHGPRSPAQTGTGSALPFASTGSQGSVRRSRARSRGGSSRRRGSPFDRRGRLQPRGRVDDVAGRHRFSAPRGGRPRLTSASPVVIPIRTCRPSSAPVSPSRMASAARTARSGSSSWAYGRAEERHHRVADELLDRAAVALELAAQALVVRRKHRAHVLRVEALGPRGEADQVTEEHRDDLALLARGRRRGERRAAGVAEARVGRVLAAAGRARRHGRSLRRVGRAATGAAVCNDPRSR